MQQGTRVFCPTSLAVCTLLALSCAGQVPPPGGPPDTAPPSITMTYPAASTTGFRDNRIFLEFSEYVDRRSVEESIFISPDVGPLEFDWSGTEVEVRFAEPLRVDITYVVTIGTDVIDVRNRNRMAESFSLAFSTGTAIDSASLGGRVFDQKPAGVTIFAYTLDDRRADTLNPATVKPEYATQTGNDGSFRLDHLAWGTYRLYAVRDQFKNLLYDPQVDYIGTATTDFVVSADRPVVERIQFRLAMEDTTAPFVLDAQPVHRNAVRIRFSEKLDDASIDAAGVSIIDTASLVSLETREPYFSLRSANVVELLTDAQDSMRTYRATVVGVRDTAGNPINPRAKAATFTGSSLPDTLAPSVHLITLPDSARNVPYAVALDFQFSEALKKEAFENGFKFVDSVGRVVPGKLAWWNSGAVRFVTASPLLPLAWYTLRLPLDSLQDFAGNRRRDTVFVRRFQTIDVRKLGSIVGRIVDPAQTDDTPTYVSAISVSDKTAVPTVKKLEGTGDFKLDTLTEGQYVLQAFRDADRNERYTMGQSFPFTPSERFTVYPDTIKVRARWPVEGVVVRFGTY